MAAKKATTETKTQTVSEEAITKVSKRLALDIRNMVGVSARRHTKRIESIIERAITDLVNG